MPATIARNLGELLVSVSSVRVCRSIVLVVLVLLTGCQPTQHGDVVSPIADLLAANRALTAYLPRPKPRWRVRGAWSHQSVFDTEPDGPVLLALSSTGAKLDVLAIDWRTGALIWRSPLAHREPPALTVAAGLALAHDINQNVAAFDLRIGQALWSHKLDCEIAPGHLGAAGSVSLLALCERGEHRRVVALDPATGATRWTQQTDDYSAELYADERHAYFPQQIFLAELIRAGEDLRVVENDGRQRDHCQQHGPDHLRGRKARSEVTS